MAQLIIVAGASGAGKSFLLEHLSFINPRIEVITKKTTRPPRPYEVDNKRTILDLKLECSFEEVDCCDFKYAYSSYCYGVEKKDIDNSLKNQKNPVLIIRDCETIHDIKLYYPDALVIYIQSGLSGEDLKEKLLSQQRDDIEITDRMSRIRKDFEEYVNYIYLFDHVIINFYDNESLLSQARSILRKKLSQPKIDQFFIFVLMSFDPKMDEIYKAFKMAARVIPNIKLRVQRMDSQKGDYKITDEILKNIRKAGLIIADFSHERPNVYYELGYARGIGKRVLHCAHIDTKLHFDIQDFHTIFYKSPINLQELLLEELKCIYNIENN